MSDELVPYAADAATAGIFLSLSELVYVSDSFEEVYDAVVGAATRLVNGCDHASLMLRGNDSFRTVASSGEVARTIDGFERELGEGPCLDAIVDDSVFHDADLTDGSPWPRLTERVLAATPVRSMAGFRLRAGDQKNGALNLFSETPGGLDGESVALLAAHERRTAETLRAGLSSNREIGKAVGLMMAFHKITDDEAFAMLRKTSQDMNLKLADVAQQVLDHHNRD
jgi:hypothetical protein